MDPAYAARYRDLFERHWWWRARERLVLRTLAARAPAGGFREVLDIGCGDGLLLPELEAYGRTLGLEADAGLVTDAGRAAGEIVVAPFDERFEPGRRFGLVTMLDVLEHLDDDAAALRHVHALLVPDGVLVLTVPALRVLWTRHDELNHHRTRYRRTVLRRRLEAAGFIVESLRYAFHWLVPVKLAVRMIEGLHQAPPRPAAVPGPALNRLLRAFTVLEQRTWGRLPWPIGSSLIAVARRGAEEGP